MSKRLTLIIGAVLGLIAVVATNIYITQQRRAAQQQAQVTLNAERKNQTAVLVAKEDIPRGTAIEPEMLETVVVPNAYVQQQAVSSLDRISGMVAAIDISAKDQITKTKLIIPRDISQGGSLAMATPVGKRAVTVPADIITSVGGMVRPGDYVDVIALIQVPVQTPDGKQGAQLATVPLFQNILILAVGQDMGTPIAETKGRYEKEEPRKVDSSIITLAFSPQESNLATFVLEQGAKLRLLLRSPADSQVQDIPPATMETLFQYIMPQATQQISESQEEAQKRKVEVYHGARKEEIYLPH